MDDQTIDLTGLDRAAVLCALYLHARPQGLGHLHFRPEPLTLDTARRLLEEGTYFDYLQGRVLKVELGRDRLDPWEYDRDNGPGAARRIIDSLRQEDTPHG